MQAEAAGHFISVMKHYLESLCSNLRSHTITNVQSNNDKVNIRYTYFGLYMSTWCTSDRLVELRANLNQTQGSTLTKPMI